MLGKESLFSFWLAAAIALGTPVGAAAQDRGGQPPVVSAGESGFTVQSPDGDYQLRFGALLNADGRFAIDDDTDRAINTFTIRRLRTSLRGRLARRFEFFINPDFAGGTLVVQDAYLDTIFSPSFRIRFGKAKTPFGLERAQSQPFTLFAERALTSAVAPNRDIGVQVIGDVAGGVVTYLGGLMNGVADGGSGDTDTTDSKDLAGRVLVRPFQKRPATDPLRGLALGVAATVGKQSGAAALPTVRSPLLQLPIVSYTGTAAGTRRRYSPHAFYLYKSFSGIVEYVHSEMAVTSTAGRGDVAHHAWHVGGSFLLTGDPATDGSAGVHPRANFDVAQRHWGALQIALRYQRLDVDDSARRFAASGSALTAEGWTAGLNWYLTPNLRYLVNVERLVFDGNGPTARPAEHAILFRSQVYF
jgi:phosphate-selective porin OprO/OprP